MLAASDRWLWLHANYPTHPAIDDEAIYALPMDVIDMICSDVPGLFNHEEEHFERELAKSSPTGFFRKRPIDYAPLSWSGPYEPRVKDRYPEEVRDIMKQQRSLATGDMFERGLDSEAIDAHFGYRDDQAAVLDELEWSYAGWLATTIPFRQECQKLRSLVAADNASDNLPGIRLQTVDGRINPDWTEAYSRYWSPFLQRWGIQRLATWELPFPMQPKMGRLDGADNIYQVAPAGILVFMPWYSLRRRSFDVNELAEKDKLLGQPAHLADWLEPKEKNWGSLRYIAMLRLYVYLELCLKSRYGDRLQGHLLELDQVFAKYFSSESEGDVERDESIRKIRQKLTKRLQGELPERQP